MVKRSISIATVKEVNNRSRHIFLLLDAIFTPKESNNDELFRCLVSLDALPATVRTSGDLGRYRTSLNDVYNGPGNGDMDRTKRFENCKKAVQDFEIRLLLSRMSVDKAFLAQPAGRAVAQVLALFKNSELVFHELGREAGPVQAVQLDLFRQAFVRSCAFDRKWFTSLAPSLQSVLFLDMMRLFCNEGYVHPILCACIRDCRQGRFPMPVISSGGRIIAHFWLGMAEEALEIEKQPLHSADHATMRAVATMLLSLFMCREKAMDHCALSIRILKEKMHVRGTLNIGQVAGLLINLTRFVHGGERELAEMRQSLAKLTGANVGNEGYTFGRCGMYGLLALDELKQGRFRRAKIMLDKADSEPMHDDNYLSRLLHYAARVRIRPSALDALEIKSVIREYEGFPFLQKCFATLLASLPGQDGQDLMIPGADSVRLLDMTALVEKMPGWEMRLTALENLASEEGIREQEKRLIWILDVEKDNVTVQQQAYGAKGWTKGRNVPLKRLNSQSAEMDWISDEDRRIISYIEQDVSFWDANITLRLSACCTALEGHNLLFQREGAVPGSLRQVQLKRGHLEFHLGEVDASCCRLSIDGTINADHLMSGVCFEQHDSEIVFYKLNDREQKVVELVGDGMDFPRSELPRVLNLTRSSLNMAMRTDNVSAEAVDPVSMPVLQLEQTAGGFTGVIGVRPFGRPDTTFFATGEGAQEPLATVPAADGSDETRTLRVRRDFAMERRELEELKASCPTLAANLELRHWSSTDIEDVLALLEELRLSPVPSRVEWPRGGRLHLSGRLEPKDIKVRIEEGARQDWFDLMGGARIDEDKFVSLKSMLSSLEGSRFVSLGDGEYLALTEDLRRRLASLKLVGMEGRKDSLELSAIAQATAGRMLSDMDLTCCPAWQCSMDRMREAMQAEPAVPSLLKAELRDYQREGYVWMQRLAIWGVGACLADDMGLGKTLQSIAVLLNQAQQGPCLVIAPTSVCGNWESEIARFAPTLATHRLGSTGRRELVSSLGVNDVLIVGYGLLPNVQEELGLRTWSMVVFDEAQNLKNARTMRARTAARLEASFRLALTGTPIENRIEDLWSLFHIINPGLLGSWERFIKRYGQAKAGSPASRSLRNIVKPFLLRRLKSAVLEELPEKTEQNILVEPNEKELAFYETLRLRAVEKLTDKEDGAGRFEILAELTRLRRACCHPGLADPDMISLEKESSKTEYFLEMAENLIAGGHKVLAFSQFTSYLAQLKTALDERGIRWQYLDGATPEKDRRASVAAFQRGEGDVFLLSLKAGGTGINLTAADYVIHLDPWWNPAVEDQASDRAHRLGQKRPVTIYRLVMAGSVEEKILELHAAKRALAAEFLEGAAEAGKTLSEEDLLNLLR